MATFETDRITLSRLRGVDCNAIRRRVGEFLEDDRRPGSA